MRPARPLGDIEEKVWAAQVAELAKMLGWRRYHTYRSERSPSGFPDDVLVRERVVWLELKTEKGKLTPHQRDWLAALIRAGQEVYVARPRHLAELGRILAARWKVTGALADETRALLTLT